MNHVTLDGVMQSPGRPDEDDRGGFTLGGWASPRGGDEIIGQATSERVANGAGLLLGRRTYEEILRHWNSIPDSPFGTRLNEANKFVATTRAGEPLPWPNSTAIVGSSVDSPDVPDAIADLSSRVDGDLGIMGSSVLVHALQRRGLIDEYLLMIHPIVLGTGIRLFADGGPADTLQLAEPVRTTAAGVIVAVYRPSR